MSLDWEQTTIDARDPAALGRLTELLGDDGYAVTRAKQKLATMRVTLQLPELACCAAWREAHPPPVSAAGSAGWLAARSAHDADPEHLALRRAARVDEARRLVSAAEQEAEDTCELDGSRPASIYSGAQGMPGLSRLCSRCARRLGGRPSAPGRLPGSHA